MNFRLFAPLFLALVALSACPTTPGADGGTPTPEFDAGNPPPVDQCSGGCAVNQICDTQTRTCRDGCNGTCDGGTCAKVGASAFQCVPVVTTCNGATCEAGQVACINGGCSCLGTTRGAVDTCAPQGKHCVGSTCTAPKRYQQCKLDGEPCPTGHVCSPVFGDDFAICVKTCGNLGGGGTCDRDEMCSEEGCLPSGLFSDQYCAKQETTADGGTRIVTLTVGNTCLLRSSNGSFTETTPTGNCTYSLFTFYDLGLYPFDLCRPPGTATEGQACKTDYSSATVATQCGTGLECVPTRGTAAGEGVCLRMCNANPPRTGFTPQPACGTGESCVNMYRLQDPNDNAVLGVCMKGCNVFDPATSSCAPVGGTPTSCVPVSANGALAVTPEGSGVCIPQQATIAGLGQTCAQTDAFKGAACAGGQLCVGSSGGAATCTRVCDVECTGTNPPARCSTEANATCPAGKTCKRVTSTTGAILGFCQ